MLDEEASSFSFDSCSAATCSAKYRLSLILFVARAAAADTRPPVAVRFGIADEEPDKEDINAEEEDVAPPPVVPEDPAIELSTSSKVTAAGTGLVFPHKAAICLDRALLLSSGILVAFKKGLLDADVAGVELELVFLLEGIELDLLWSFVSSEKV